MAPITKLALSALFAAQASAHFQLRWPTGLGNDDANQPTAPCGGYTADFVRNSVSDFHVGGEAIYTVNTHPTVNFLYRATLDQTAKGGFVNLVSGPIQVNGLNGACNPAVPAPASFVGKKGIIQVIANAPDGLLYQCAAVNFVSGTAPSPLGGCTNSTGVSMSYASDDVLQGITANQTGPSSSGEAHNHGGSSASATPSASRSAAAGTITSTKGATGTVAWVVLLGIGSAVLCLI